MSTNKTYTKTQIKPNTNQNLAVRRKPKKGTNWLLLGFGLSAIAVFSATAGAILAFSLSKSPLSQVKLTPEEESIFNKNKEETITYSSLNIPELSRPVNILVLGVKVTTTDLYGKADEELGYQALVNSFHGLTDTMLLLRFDPKDNKFTVLSIPRDTKTEIEGYGVKKINEANYDGGPGLAAETVSKLLGGVTIDRYMRINVQGIEKLIDALGGLNVYVPKDMKYSDDSQHLYIDLKEGQQHLNGNQAIQFLRFRHDGGGDIGRVQRQQLLMRAVVEQALSPQTIMKVPDILSVIHTHIDTNVSAKELMALSAFVGQKNRSDVQMLMLPGDFNTPKENEPSYWLPNEDKIQEMMTKHFEVEVDYDYNFDGNYSVEQNNDFRQVKIAIQDNTDNPEAAQAMVRHLQDLGYTRVFISESNDHQPLINTKIVAQNGDDAEAAEIRANLGMGEVLVESTGVLNSDVTIQLGQDWIQNPVIKENYSGKQ